MQSPWSAHRFTWNTTVPKRRTAPGQPCPATAAPGGPRAAPGDVDQTGMFHVKRRPAHAAPMRFLRANDPCHAPAAAARRPGWDSRRRGTQVALLLTPGMRPHVSRETYPAPGPGDATPPARRHARGRASLSPSGAPRLSPGPGRSPGLRRDGSAPTASPPTNRRAPHRDAPAPPARTTSTSAHSGTMAATHAKWCVDSQSPARSTASQARGSPLHASSRTPARPSTPTSAPLNLAASVSRHPARAVTTIS